MTSREPGWMLRATLLELEMARSRVILAGVVDSARHRARETYDTGNRAQSRECLKHHLGEDDRLALVTADHYHCGECGHCLKARPGTHCPDGVES